MIGLGGLKDRAVAWFGMLGLRVEEPWPDEPFWPEDDYAAIVEEVGGELEHLAALTAEHGPWEAALIKFGDRAQGPAPENTPHLGPALTDPALADITPAR